MRTAMMLGAFLFMMGVTTMSDQTAVADEPKKDEKKSPSKKESYEKMTVKKWASSMFLNPVDNVPAFRGEIAGKTVIYTKPRAGNSESPKGSEITEADGTVWVVDKVTRGDAYHINYVTKKEPEKKP